MAPIITAVLLESKPKVAMTQEPTMTGLKLILQATLFVAAGVGLVQHHCF